MNSYINYLVEANLGLLLFLLCYKLLLNNETDFRFKRSYLLFTILSSLFFPLLKFHLFDDGMLSMRDTIATYLLPEVVVTGYNTQAANGFSSITVWQALQWVYCFGAAFFTMRFVWQLKSLLILLKKYPAFHWENKYVITEINENLPTFSFFNHIFIGRAHQLGKNEKQQILDHEKIHADKYHSIDILLIEVVGIIFWFNPFIQVYKKNLTTIHEFQADESATKLHDVNQYCNLLARVALLSADFKLANHFNNSLTLKRITMMKSIKNKMSVWKITALVPVIACFLFVVAFQEQVVAQEKSGKVKIDDTDNKDEIYAIVDEPAKFPNGMEGLMDFLKKNLQYPEKAKKEKVDGKVFVQMVIEKDGSVTDVKVIKGLEKSVDEEALRVIKLSPNWRPGKNNGIIVRSRFVIPIYFKV